MEEYKMIKKAIEKCDEETPYACYCGRLATGLHTSRCKKYQSKVKKYTKEFLKRQV